MLDVGMAHFLNIVLAGLATPFVVFSCQKSFLLVNVVVAGCRVVHML